MDEAGIRFAEKHPQVLPSVQTDEVFIVAMVLGVWIGAVYIFFNQWGKSKSKDGA